MKWNNSTVPAKSGNDESSNDVEIVESHIYFYTAVNSRSSLQIVKALREVEQYQAVVKFRGEQDNPVIHLHINSPGGAVTDMFAVVDVIKSLSIPVHAYGEGLIASAATFLFCACNKRYIGKHTASLFHQFSTVHWGTHEDFKDEMEYQNMIMAMFVDFYKAHSNMDENTIREMLKRDTWLSPQEMIKRELADEIIGEIAEVGND